MSQPFLKTVVIGAWLSIVAMPLTITETTNGSTLGSALGGGGSLTINSVTIINGAESQFGTYTGFSSGPVTIGNGVILSTGQVAQALRSFNNGAQGPATTPSTDTGQLGTQEFNAYGIGRIANFSTSNDVAALQVVFTLSSPTQAGFDFVFGSAEYPQFTSLYTDAFLVFLDGAAASNQIVFDNKNNPVQVGASFSTALSTTDVNTAFSNPHGVLLLQTFMINPLSTGIHTLRFEIGDVNDHRIDSAVFISNLRAGMGTPGTTPTIPEPRSIVLCALGLASLAVVRRFPCAHARSSACE